MDNLQSTKADSGLDHNLLHMIRDTEFWGESVTDSRPRQAHQSACKGRGQGSLPCLKMVCQYCISFSSGPSLSHNVRLSAIQYAGRGNEPVNNGDGGAS